MDESAQCQSGSRLVWIWDTSAGILGGLLLVVSSIGLVTHAFVWRLAVQWVNFSIADVVAFISPHRSADLIIWVSDNDALYFIFVVAPAEAVALTCGLMLIGLGYWQSRCCASPSPPNLPDR